jgi:hypothetical protein
VDPGSIVASFKPANLEGRRLAVRQLAKIVRFIQMRTVDFLCPLACVHKFFSAFETLEDFGMRRSASHVTADVLNYTSARVAIHV